MENLKLNRNEESINEKNSLIETSLSIFKDVVKEYVQKTSLALTILMASGAIATNSLASDLAKKNELDMKPIIDYPLLTVGDIEKPIVDYPLLTAKTIKEINANNGLITANTSKENVEKIYNKLMDITKNEVSIQIPKHATLFPVDTKMKSLSMDEKILTERFLPKLEDLSVGMSNGNFQGNMEGAKLGLLLAYESEYRDLGFILNKYSGLKNTIEDLIGEKISNEEINLVINTIDNMDYFAEKVDIKEDMSLDYKTNVHVEDKYQVYYLPFDKDFNFENLKTHVEDADNKNDLFFKEVVDSPEYRAKIEEYNKIIENGIDTYNELENKNSYDLNM